MLAEEQKKGPLKAGRAWIFFVKLPPTRNHASNSRSRYKENSQNRIPDKIQNSDSMAFTN